MKPTRLAGRGSGAKKKLKMNRRRFANYMMGMSAAAVTPKISFAQTLSQTKELRLALTTEIEFDHYWVAYLSAKVGCPLLTDGSISRTLTARDCTLEPSVDAGSYYKARELAKKVFKLKD